MLRPTTRTTPWRPAITRIRAHSALDPKATVQAVLAQYQLGPGDLVVIDTGTYGGTVTITAADEGAAYAGSPGGSVFNHSGTRFELADADHNSDLRLDLRRFVGHWDSPAQCRDRSFDQQ
jgi:hypothetical protein